MKTWMKVVLGIFTGIAALVGLIFWLTGDITKAGDDFFAAVQNDDMDAAYALLSEDFQTTTSKEGLRAYLAANTLDKVQSVSWKSRSITNNTGELEGTITTQKGGAIPIKLGLVKSDSGWKIFRLVKAAAGFRATDSTEIIKPQMPPQVEQIRLVKETTNIFAGALNDKDMKALYDHGSKEFRRTNSVPELTDTFKSFEEFGPELLRLKEQAPGLREPVAIDERGRLSISGFYDMKLDVFVFDQHYELEDGRWKLDEIGIDIERRENMR